MDDLELWLVNNAPHETVSGVFDYFYRQLATSGISVWRAPLGLEVLHPEVSGWQHVWIDEPLTLESTDRATAPMSQFYLSSPARVVDETEQRYRRV